MRIGVHALLNRMAGGAFQYSDLTIRSLCKLIQGSQDELVILASDPDHKELETFKPTVRIERSFPPVQRGPARALTVSLLGQGRVKQALRKLRRPQPDELLPDPDSPKWNENLRSWFESMGLDLVFYPSAVSAAFEARLPYALAIHDLQHRLQPDFPEVSVDGERERREYLYRNGSRYATTVLADSEIGKEDILNYYGEFGVEADRVMVLPFAPSAHLDTSVSPEQARTETKALGLPDDYLFYPAQFWPHKNHERLIEALATAQRENGLKAPLVLCGGHDGPILRQTYERVMDRASEVGVTTRLYVLGYVSDRTLSALYRNALALVMPTFFGPTNIPVVEAWSFGLPVVTSDIRGIREQVGEAAVLADPTSVPELAQALIEVCTDSTRRNKLAAAGLERVAGYSEVQFRNRLGSILNETRKRATEEGFGGASRHDID